MARVGKQGQRICNQAPDKLRDQNDYGQEEGNAQSLFCHAMYMIVVVSTMLLTHTITISQKQPTNKLNMNHPKFLRRKNCNAVILSAAKDLSPGRAQILRC